MQRPQSTALGCWPSFLAFVAFVLLAFLPGGSSKSTGPCYQRETKTHCEDVTDDGPCTWTLCTPDDPCSAGWRRPGVCHNAPSVIAPAGPRPEDSLSSFHSSPRFRPGLAMRVQHVSHGQLIPSMSSGALKPEILTEKVTDAGTCARQTESLESSKRQKDAEHDELVSMMGKTELGIATLGFEIQQLDQSIVSLGNRTSRGAALQKQSPKALRQVIGNAEMSRAADTKSRTHKNSARVRLQEELAHQKGRKEQLDAERRGIELHLLQLRHECEQIALDEGLQHEEPFLDRGSGLEEEESSTQKDFSKSEEHGFLHHARRHIAAWKLLGFILLLGFSVIFFIGPMFGAVGMLANFSVAAFLLPRYRKSFNGRKLAENTTAG